MNISEYWDPAFALSTQDILNGQHSGYSEWASSSVHNHEDT